MKKFIFSLVLLIGTAMMTFAQQTTVEGSRFFDNTYVNMTVGGQVGMHDFTGHHNWTVAPDLNLYFGKWLTPIFGLELNGDMVMHDGFSVRNRFVDASYVGLAGKLNLNNVFHNYRIPNDRVEVMPFVGFGWLHAYGNGTVGTHGNVPTSQMVGQNNLATKMGVDICFNLGKTHAWAIDVRPTVMYSLTGHGNSFPKYDSRFGRVGLEVGVKYNFGHKNSRGETVHNFTPVSPCEETVRYETTERVDTVYVTQVEVQEVMVTNSQLEYVLPSPYFAQGRYNLDPTSYQVLNTLAEQIKSDGGVWNVTGWASVEGTELINTNLSRNRAETVKNTLVELGVNPDNLNVVVGGPTDRFGNQFEQNRTVTVTKN